MLGQHQSLSALAGTVSLGRDAWEVVNTSTYSVIAVSSEVGIGEQLLEPGGDGIFRWPSATISVRTSDAGVFTILATYSPRSSQNRWSSDSSTAKPTVDRQKAYFFALLLLCEPRLRNEFPSDIRSDKEIARLLVQSGIDPAATAKKVEKRLDDARRHFQLQSVDLEACNVGRSSIRPRLIDAAIRTGAVSRADLALLE